MNFDYFRNVLVVFLSTFMVSHLAVRGLTFERQIQYSMLSTCIYIVYYIVKNLSGVDGDDQTN